jgi:hypothetical protein
VLGRSEALAVPPSPPDADAPVLEEWHPDVAKEVAATARPRRARVRFIVPEYRARGPRSKVGGAGGVRAV